MKALKTALKRMVQVEYGCHLLIASARSRVLFEVHYSAAEKKQIAADFQFINARLIDDPRGMHKNLKRELDAFLGPMGNMAAEMRVHDKQKKRRRTWADSNPRTMYLD